MEKDVRWRLRVAKWAVLRCCYCSKRGRPFSVINHNCTIFLVLEKMEKKMNTKKVASSLPDECPMKGHLIRNYVHWPKGWCFVRCECVCSFYFPSELTIFLNEKTESIAFNKDNSFDVFFIIISTFFFHLLMVEISH